MGEYVLTIALAIASILVVSCVWRVLRWGWWRPKKLEKYLMEQGIKGPPYKFLYGNLQEEMRLMKNVQSKPISLSHDIVPRVFPFVHQSINNYGKMFVSWFGPIPRVYITDPVLIRDILSNKFGHFQKPKTNPYAKLLSNGVATREGEDWAKHRRIINPAFHIEKLKHMLPAFYTSCCELVNKWEKLVASKGLCELDVWTEMKNLTGDVISRAAFGSNYEEGMKIVELQTEQAALMIEASRSLYIPGSRFIPTQRNRRMKEIDGEVRALLRRIISKRMKGREILEESKKDDLLGILLESNAKEIKESGKSKNAGLSMEDVMGECKLFYFAGQETTAVLLTWTMIVLSMHPDWQSRAREEVLQIFGENKPTFDGLNQLKIVTMVLYEVLRLYPAATMLNRFTYKEMKLGEFTLPEGVWLTLPEIIVHRDREFWGEDAEEFNPERFSEGILKASKNQVVSFFPFGWGPRICIGQNFAMLEAKMAMAMILQNFWFELSPSYAHAPHTVVTLQPQYGAPIILHKL
ncbi:cytochrome P450 CYP72A219-like [Telopea speciosissima]|uniref:cytochrome P450 CYP72A219-like n=1 Tax=Telopea speciosissima TaxID=54955 RepID=UPI001CC4DAC5|nr:cytochrome P450 CYP72A219-like [Telopea speciosissima]